MSWYCGRAEYVVEFFTHTVTENLRSGFRLKKL